MKTNKNEDIWKEVDDFLKEHHDDLGLSFGLEYSAVVDWNADFTPRHNHPQARQYGLWRGSGATREQAVRNAIDVAKKAIGDVE